jgi:hypothetical protein
MGQEIAASGVAITVISTFIRWALPVVPKPIAWSGVGTGIAVLLAVWTLPQMNITLPAVGLFLVGVLCIAGAVNMSLRPKSTPARTVWLHQQRTELAMCPTTPASSLKGREATMRLESKFLTAGIGLILMSGSVMAQSEKPTTNTMGNVINNQGIVTQGRSETTP